MIDGNVLDKFNLKNRTAVITGGAGLLGKQHAKALAAAGANCVLLDINENALFMLLDELKTGSEYTGEIIVQVVDITDKKEVKAASQKIISRFGLVDILINNAALNPKVKSGGDLLEPTLFENFSIEQWDREISVGLTGALICSQVFGVEMAKRGSGVILNISSDLGVIAPDQRIYSDSGRREENQPVKPVTYSVIKAGLAGLTRYLSTYWADKNVRVNSLCPGGIYDGQPEDFVRRLSNLIPMGRMADKDEYQAAVLFLVSDASSYMTGANLIIDGGRTVW